jgi:hypothetical protein
MTRSNQFVVAYAKRIEIDPNDAPYFVSGKKGSLFGCAMVVRPPNPMDFLADYPPNRGSCKNPSQY